MLTISKVFTILCLLCLCGNREYPGSFQNKSCGDNVNYYKSVHHPIPTLPVGIGNTLAIFKKKSVSSPLS